MGDASSSGRAWQWVLGVLLALGVVLLAVVPRFVANGVSAPDQKEARMRTSNTLVVYYSRTGTTEKLAHAIAQRTEADVERLRDTVDRRGAMGFMRSLWDAIRRRGSTLQPLELDPTQYQLVIIGTPDWGKGPSAPVRTFLSTYRGKLHQVAFFLTDGWTDHQAVWNEMTTLGGDRPVATLGLPHEEVLVNRFADRLELFVHALPKIEPMVLPVPAASEAAQEARF
jgi:hypothetical protein